MFKITDYRVYGIAYDFMQFDGMDAMGGMELIVDLGYVSGNPADDDTAIDPHSGRCL